MLTHVTFTGWDDQADIPELRAFLADYRPRTIEIAVLASATAEPGRERYPVIPDAADILEAASAVGQRTALHLCGKLARMALDTPDDFKSRIVSAYWYEVSREVDRVQVNVPEEFWPATTAPAERYASAVNLASALGRPVIVQVRGDRFPSPLPGVVYLFDQSAGRGRAAEVNPPRPHTGEQLVGYAGGLGPANVAAFLSRITMESDLRPAWLSRLDHRPFWIDMESGIREPVPTADNNIGRPPSIVSITRCRDVMQAVAHHLEGG